LQEKIEDKEYYAAHKNGEFIIRVNDTHQNNRIVKVSIDNPGKENWTEVIAPSDDRTIVNHSVFKDFNVYCFREEGLKYFEVHMNDGKIKKIPFPADAYQVGEGSNYNWDTKNYRFNYSALNQPATVYDYDVTTEKSTEVYMKEVPNFNPEDYKVERVYAEAEDGAKIPMSLVYKKDFPIDGSRPAFLYGYGSYGACIDPSFVDRIFTFVDRGFVFALGHVRGSMTMGRQWYEDGKFLKKKNTFSDFRDCAKFLIDKKYSSKGNISISGGSAGGLLMGATMNLAPELFKSIVAAVPFVDVLNTMLDSSLPLTKLEYKEWGNPEESKEYYDYIKSYSPYDNIEKKDYPHLLCTGGLNDPRVTYWEPTKFVARMRDNKTNDSLTLLKINMGGGHFGASGRFEYLKEYALEYAFMLSCHGITS
jgi:oligopeptidase B